MSRFLGRLAVQQRVLPNYRAPFFDLLASACNGRMSLFTGLPRPSEGITTTDQLRITNYHLGQNIHLFSGPLYLCYQRGLIGLARKLESRCADRGSKSTLHFHFICCKVDAQTRSTRDWLGIRFAASEWN